MRMEEVIEVKVTAEVEAIHVKHTVSAFVFMFMDKVFTLNISVKCTVKLYININLYTTFIKIYFNVQKYKTEEIVH